MLGDTSPRAIKSPGWSKTKIPTAEVHIASHKVWRVSSPISKYLLAPNNCPPIELSADKIPVKPT